MINAKLMVTSLMAILASFALLLLCSKLEQKFTVTAAVTTATTHLQFGGQNSMLNSFAYHNSNKWPPTPTGGGMEENVGNVFVVTQPAECKLLTSDLQSSAQAQPSDAEWLLLIFQCDTKPMIRLFEKLWQRVNNKTIRNQWDLFFGGHSSTNTAAASTYNYNQQAGATQQTGPDSTTIWREYLSFDCFVNHFITEARFALSHQDYCSYSTISRIGQLRAHVLGSRLLSTAYDMITIQYHSTCLEKALNKLPQVPYLVREVVDIYVDGVEKPIPDLNSASDGASFADDDDEGDQLNFDVDRAIASNGPLSSVVPLAISLPFGIEAQLGVQAFKRSCKEFCIELEERWQSMEMMNKMLATGGNGIETFNNYVMRLLIPTKYADACSKLSATVG